MNEWNALAKEVDEQTTKQQIYDAVLLDFCYQDCENKTVLDFGGGTGEIAQQLQQITRDIKSYDESEQMRASTAEKIGSENVYHTLAEIPKDFFDTLVSSLVICVVKKDDLDEIMTIMTDSLKKGGVAYFGFCNPEDFAVEDTKLQHRHTTGCSYEEEHEYKKTIREGEFTITEQHRPIPFYEALFRRYGYSVLDKKYSTPEHIDGVECSDFVMYTLRKED